MNDRVFVRLRILSHAKAPEDLARLIGLAPEHSWRIGDTRGKTQIKEKTNGWLVTSGMDESTALDEQLPALLARVLPVADRIAALADEATVEVSCAVYAAQPPALSFPSDLVQQLARLRAGLDIDLYVMGEESG